MKKEEAIKKIIEGIIDFKVIPFLGAGMSKTCGALDWSEIIDDLKKDLITSSSNYLEIAQEFEDNFGRATLIRKLKKGCKLKVLSSESLENHMKILAMNPPVIYTTNYDNAIEEAASQLIRDYKKIVSLNDIVDSKHDQRQIIKFHGDFSDDSSIVFTRKDYDKRLKANENHLDIQFRSHILGKSVLFLGYSFGDENIDYIFKKHTELYGTKNLPKSYIVSFSNDPTRENKLQEKNIITLVLEGPSELSSLIGEVSSKVFELSIDAQFQSMFKPLPSILLTRFELEHLQDYITSSEFTNEEKHNKIRETLEGKSMPQDVEESLVTLFEQIIEDEVDLKIKEAVLISFQHTQFRKIENIIKLSIGLLKLTEHREFVLSFGSDNWGSDVLMVLEYKLSKFLKDSVECRKWICLLILTYLEGMIAENKNLSFDQANRLLNGLKNNGYEDFETLGAGYDKERIKYVIDHYLAQHGSTLKTQFERKSFRGRRPQTSMEIMEQMIKSLPKNLNK